MRGRYRTTARGRTARERRSAVSMSKRVRTHDDPAEANRRAEADAAAIPDLAGRDERPEHLSLSSVSDAVVQLTISAGKMLKNATIPFGVVAGTRSSAADRMMT